MTVSELQDGQPLTFEWLNSLVKEIKSISNSVNRLESVDSIDIIGTSTSNLQIAVQKVTISKLDNDEAIGDIQFAKAFKNAPIVVATVDQKSVGNINPISAVASISGVTSTGFRCRVMLTDDSSKFNKRTTTVGVSYIAIGDAL